MTRSSVDEVLEDGGLEALWFNCLRLLREKVRSQILNAWFRPLRLVSVEDGRVTLLAANEIVRDFNSQHYQGLLEEVLGEAFGRPVAVQLGLDPSLAPRTEPALRSRGPLPMAAAATSRPPSRDGALLEARRLLPRLSFELFVEGDCNRLALTASHQVAASPGTGRSNPLVLIGGTGLGKTHLLHAVGHFALKNETARKVVYRTSEEFSSEFMEHVVRRKAAHTFHEIYRDADILLLDDIQFFGEPVDKPRFRAEMVQILTILQRQRKQVVLTCDRLPNEVRHFDRQILGRIETGLTVDLRAPDHATRIAILRRKVVEGGWELSDDVLTVIASQFDANVRQLEGALLKLIAFSDLCGGTVTPQTARSVLSDAVRNRDNQLTPTTIAEAVAAASGLDPALLRTRTRKREVARARHLAMLLVHELTDNTLHTIGVYFGRDYSTVIHSLGVARQLLADDPEAAQVFGAARSSLSA